MSTMYKSSRDVPTGVLADRLDELAEVVSKSSDRIDAEFTMRIPAECDRDADLVMNEAARRLRATQPAKEKPVGYFHDVTADDDLIQRWVQSEWAEDDAVPLFASPSPADHVPDARNMIGQDEVGAIALLTEIRFACGDNGRRMQPELVEHIRELARDAARYRRLRHHICIIGGPTPRFEILEIKPTYCALVASAELDAVIDDMVIQRGEVADIGRKLDAAVDGRE